MAIGADAVITSQLDRAIGHRHGLVPPPVNIPVTPADIAGIQNWSVAYSAENQWRSAGGGVGWTLAAARNAAIAEALERYAAVSYRLPIFDRTGHSIAASHYASPLEGTASGDSPLATLALEKPTAITPIEVLKLEDFTLFSAAQLESPNFPHHAAFQEESALTDVYRLKSNQVALAPAALVGLTDEYGALPTSSGLAAAPTTEQALLRATQELIERDAYMATWLHGLVPPRATLCSTYTQPVAERDGWVAVFDITPVYSSHSVAMVVGNLPMAGAPRVSLGLACRAQWDEAVDKAYLEWSQGVIFAGHRCRREPTLGFSSASDVRNFDDHAVYYTVHPDRWEDLPFMKKGPSQVLARTTAEDPIDPTLEALVNRLESHSVRLYYRDLTLIDLAQIDLRVVRVLTPDLTPIHSDHRWPHLGGTTFDVARRYPWASQQAWLFPSRHPHPLG